MAIQFVSVKCPQCGADLSIESDRQQAFCGYCGTKVIVNNENEHIYRNIDEARIKESETERLIRLKELELEEKENAKGRRTSAIAYGVALIFLIVALLNMEENPTVGMWGILIAIYIGLFTVGKSRERKKKARRILAPDEVQITDAMSKFEDQGFNSVVVLFQSAGFTNVNAVPLKDLTILNPLKNGKVDRVTINGDFFEHGDVFKRDAKVVIMYHSL